MSRQLPILATLLVLAGHAGCARTTESAAPSGATQPVPEALLDIDDPAACSECHKALVDEWKQSMHARAHHELDPIYAGIRRIRMKREGDAIARMCSLCHTPRGADDHEAAAAKVGVGCAACHNVEAVHRAEDRKGRAALDYAGGQLLLGPHDLEPDSAEAHGAGAAPAHMRDGSILCLACHDALNSANGTPICTTGPERAMLSDGKSCVSCHMPRVGGPSGDASDRDNHPSHAFPGPRRAWYQADVGSAARAVRISGKLALGKLAVTLANESGHGFPTGFPGRIAILQVVGFDASGAKLWQSWSSDPMTESPDSVFNKVYNDAEGNPTLPPYAETLTRDNRLRPGETRTLTFTPPAEVSRVKVRLLLQLLPAPLAVKIGLADAPEAEPREIVVTELALQ